MSSTRRSGGRSRTSNSSERDGQQGDENRANRHQSQHSRESREEFYRRNQTGETNDNILGPVVTVPETVTPMAPAIMRPVIRHSVTGLRIPRVGSIPISTMERRISAQTRRFPTPSPVSQAMRPGIETAGHISTDLGQTTQPTTSIVDRVPSIESYTATRTRSTATITRAEMENREGQGTDNTSDEDMVKLTSSQESNNEQVTEGYSDDVSSGVEQAREENEDMWYIGEYEIERSPTPQISSPVPTVPQRPADIRDILETIQTQSNPLCQ